MKLVILDRDGVINQDSANFIKNPNEWIPIAGSLEAIALLNQSGFRVAIATNQSGVSRGLFDMTTLNSIHDKMHRELAQVGGRIDAIFYCPHAADEHCHCRKPETGMIEEIGLRFSMELSGVPAVGDALRDLQAFASSGCQPILVRTGKGEATLAASQQDADKALPANTWICADLAEAAQRIIAEQE
ncbi:D-glycero-beta-D-manno-heptose 1,7-bisphosphate 7-phosphatase [Methylotenera sp.]|uniref:D-glycero-beta-D-manno-heptose 1,7-bisphosphate 7-phosphatase n=1 Tax=Methylotenera sp. TaxID=2051956 RepID=UPI00271E1745|nr:D-glycero-beta-D-manno-heptose 1,7-bisphosphate 7-phosphatase [Methylotenera sp.]MDO9206188.1 D-glycero-beta-D-manno-heptose 1,7-bisphosphate 7-phosphatase [Methylotenera sp.]MDO9393984.1 D-glycero-beta-D-manno-heptose 1,7-bisphosphate 7-phosphatase [Methylotenera sp.]MDP1523734.1 D-glycero-beta-D-manno-heptose 1,7-bisphosphate 7-phosphatase [Methylotenera sp.]MDP2070886.1 D-glycero-beta-D-manno-heptose 1,7-bisphosphate 7-phosphatase [Methylotenera sp.]MDP2230240.1 D-glycero-beta-D-manno-he